MEFLFTNSQAILTGIALLVVFLFFRVNKKNPHYPPGPISLPLLGNVLQLGRDPSKVLQKWAEEYGPIYSIKMGTEDTIVLSDSKLVRELFFHPNSIGKGSTPVLYVFGGGNGIINAQGHVWETQRNFTLRKLRDAGAFKSSIEGFLQEEARTLIKYFEQRAGESIPGTRLFNGPVINSLWKIISGESIDWTSPIKPEILKRAENLTESMNQTVLSGLFFAPFLRHVAPDFFGWTSWVNSVKNFFAVTDQAIETHSDKLDLNNPQDFIDNYLMEIRATQDPSSTFYKENGEKNLKAIVGDLFFAGAETSSTTLSFAILYLCQNQEKQRKAQNELDLVIGSSHQISLSDKVSLPYTEAIVMETLRLSSIVPLGIPHQMIADTEFHGYLLPKGITIMPNLYTIHHDKKIWGEDANLFRPERFLNEDETRFVHNDALIPFSAGRRQCLGEGLARDTIFLFIANILQYFDIGPDPESPVLDMETVPGILVEPKPFKFVLNLRK